MSVYKEVQVQVSWSGVKSIKESPSKFFLLENFSQFCVWCKVKARTHFFALFTPTTQNHTSSYNCVDIHLLKVKPIFIFLKILQLCWYSFKDKLKDLKLHKLLPYKIKLWNRNRCKYIFLSKQIKCWIIKRYQTTKFEKFLLKNWINIADC